MPKLTVNEDIAYGAKREKRGSGSAAESKIERKNKLEEICTEIRHARSIDARIHTLLDDLYRVHVHWRAFKNGFSHDVWSLFVLWHANEIREQAGPYILVDRDIVIPIQVPCQPKQHFLPREYYRRSRTYYPAIQAECREKMPDDIVDMIEKGDLHHARRRIIELSR